jgi:YVTN family beta-propeller protein
MVGSDAVHVLDPKTNRMVDEIPVGASPHYPTFTPDGYGALVVAQGPGELDVVDAEDHDLEERIAVGTFPHWLAISDDGSTAYVSNEGSNDVSVVNLRTDTVTATIPVGNAPRKIAIQPGAMSQTSPAGTAPSGVATDARLVAAANTMEDDGDQPAVTLAADDYTFTPSSLQGLPGQTVTLSLQNASGTLHNFSIAGLADQDLRARGSATVDVTLPDSGVLDFFCKYHAALGMRGQIVVQNAATS